MEGSEAGRILDVVNMAGREARCSLDVVVPALDHHVKPTRLTSSLTGLLIHLAVLRGQSSVFAAPR